MDVITGQHLPRRTFLRGVGATVALPFLDAMIPARGAFGKPLEAAAADRTRLVCIEEVHGLPGCNNWGASKFLFGPEQTGPDFTLVPDNPLKTVEAYRDYMTIVSNTDVHNAEALSLPEIGGDHFRSSAVFLTQSHPKQTNGSDLWAGTSLDQLYAQRFGQSTPMPSMQFCIENLDQAGGCTYNYSCAYTDTISWASPNEPLPMIRDPRDREERRGAELQAVIVHPGCDQERRVSDETGGAGLDDGATVKGDETCTSSLESTCRGGRSSAAWAPQWRCPSWTR